MKVAIFGGSFNPVHSEHINIVKAAIKLLSLDKVIVMPTNITPAKNGRMLTSAEDRLNMCRLAFSDIESAVVSDYEISKDGVSYSYLTCRAFKERYPCCDRYLIVGGDMAENFAKWRYPEEILKCVKLAVCARVDEARLEDIKKDFFARFGQELCAFDYTGKNISSTRIRARAALGESLNGDVSEKVEEYIRDNSLYLIGGADRVKSSMSPYRWRHTVGVAAMAAENCVAYGVAEADAVTAALFHDCGKEIPLDSELLKGFIAPPNVPASVVHQFTGAYLAENVYGIKDKNILNAVKYHCSGRENMSPLEKLIYVCDMLEEGRTFDGVNALREQYFSDREAGFIKVIERQLKHLKASGMPIYELTQKAYDYAKEHKK